MRKEIISAIQEKVKTELNIPVYVYEPEFSEAVLNYPIAVIAMGQETAEHALKSKGYRVIPVSILIVAQAMIREAMQKKYFELLDLSDICDEKLNQYKFPVGSKTPWLQFERINWFEEYGDENDVIFGASVDFNCFTTR